MSDKKFRKLKIDEELRDLLPPLTEDEYRILEENVKRDGCIDYIVTWNDYIVDGHNRYGICEKCNYGFEEFKLAYETKDEVIQWMLDTQLGRRNLTDVQRIIIAEKCRNVIEEKAKKNQLSGLKNQNIVLSNSKERVSSVDTLKELAKTAKVGTEKYWRANKILKSDNEEIKQQIINGKISVNKAYNQLYPKKENEKEYDNLEKLRKYQEETEVSKGNNRIKNKVCLKCGQDKNIDDFYIGHDKCKNCEQNNEKVVGGNKEVFRDTEGNPIPITEEGKINNDEFQKMLKDIKTSKSYDDFANPKSEIEILSRTCDDLIWQIDAKIFSMNKLINKMDKDDIDTTIKLLDNHIIEINKIKNKLNNEKVGK